MNAVPPVLILLAVVIGVIAIAGHMNHHANRYPLPMLGAAVVLGLLAWMIAPADARDDGRYAGSSLKGWFDQLKSGKGPCCSDADGSAVSDVDWETKDGKYRVRIEGEWYDVPSDALITEPNRAGRTMVWPFYLMGRLQVRCFMPGSMI